MTQCPDLPFLSMSGSILGIFPLASIGASKDSTWRCIALILTITHAHGRKRNKLLSHPFLGARFATQIQLITMMSFSAAVAHQRSQIVLRTSGNDLSVVVVDEAICTLIQFVTLTFNTAATHWRSQIILRIGG